MKKEIEALMEKLASDTLAEQDIGKINRLMFGFNEVPAAASLVLVLGSSSIKRIVKAVELSNNYQVPLLISGGNYLEKVGLYEFEMYYIYALTHGVAAGRIILEGKSSNTLENINNSFRMMGDKYTDIVIVSSSQHLFRVKLMLEKMGLAAKYNIYYVASYATLVPRDRWYKEEKAKEIIRGELERVIKYKLI